MGLIMGRWRAGGLNTLGILDLINRLYHSFLNCRWEGRLMASAALTKFSPRESLFGILKPHDFSWIQNFLSAIQTHISVVAGGYFHKLQYTYAHGGPRQLNWTVSLKMQLPYLQATFLWPEYHFLCIFMSYKELLLEACAGRKGKWTGHLTEHTVPF